MKGLLSNLIPQGLVLLVVDGLEVGDTGPHFLSA